jgi:hypothetical protein
MKKLAIILLTIFIAFPLFADDCEDALQESTELLELAFERIEELEAENAALKEGSRVEELEAEVKFLEDLVLSYEVALAEASNALSDSNDILQQAYDRIDADGTEIEMLRGHVQNLISAGVEIKTYDWNVIVTSGYPLSIGVMVGYNLPFFTSIGFVAGIHYNIDSNIPSFQAGLKINIGKD